MCSSDSLMCVWFLKIQFLGLLVVMIEVKNIYSKASFTREKKSRNFFSYKTCVFLENLKIFEMMIFSKISWVFFLVWGRGLKVWKWILTFSCSQFNEFMENLNWFSLFFFSAATFSDSYSNSDSWGGSNQSAHHDQG